MHFLFKSCCYLGVVVLLVSCKTAKVVSIEQLDVFQIEEAFIQKEIPGQQGEEAKIYMTIQFSEESYSVYPIDSVLVKGKYATFSTKEKLNAAKNPSKFRLKKADVKNENQSTQAYVYFKREEKKYYQIIDFIQIKEPIYLP